MRRLLLLGLLAFIGFVIAPNITLIADTAQPSHSHLLADDGDNYGSGGG